MPVFHPACFAGGIHLNIEDEVAGGLRVPGWGAFALGKNAKCNTNILPLLLVGLLPVVIAVLFVKTTCFLQGARHLDAILDVFLADS